MLTHMGPLFGSRQNHMPIMREIVIVGYFRERLLLWGTLGHTITGLFHHLMMGSDKPVIRSCFELVSSLQQGAQPVWNPPGFSCNYTCMYMYMYIIYTLESYVEVVGVKESQNLLVTGFIFTNKPQLFGGHEHREPSLTTRATVNRPSHAVEDPALSAWNLVEHIIAIAYRS